MKSPKAVACSFLGIYTQNRLLSQLRPYLIGQMQVENFRFTISTIKTNDNGDVQVSELRPTLFLIYKNDIFRTITCLRVAILAQ